MPKFDLNKIKSNCELCTWYLGEKKCPAFFNLVIPDEVWKGEHEEEVEGQVKGILFNKVGDLL